MQQWMWRKLSFLCNAGVVGWQPRVCMCSAGFISKRQCQQPLLYRQKAHVQSRVILINVTIICMCV